MRTGMNCRCSRIPGIMLALLLVVGLAGGKAQLTGGTLTGTITDPQGAAIPGASVKATNTATGVSTTVAANGDGIYHIVNLLPGPYELTVTVSGFATGITKNIALEVGQVQTINFAMAVSSSLQTVEVSADRGSVDLASASLSYQVTGTTMREMPLN